MIGRRMLGGLAAAAGIGTGAMQRTSLTASLANIPVGAVGEQAPAALDNTELKKKHDLFRKLIHPHESRYWRQRQRVELLGGIPPGILCMKSNADWFKAAIAQKRLQEIEDQKRSIFDTLHEKIFGWKIHGDDV